MQTISWLTLSWCLLPILIISVIYWRWFGTIKEVITASARMLIQLVAVGYLLLVIFAQPSVGISLLVMLVMLIAASWIAIRPVKQHAGILLPAAIALVVSVVLHLIISLQLVLQVELWFDPRVLIPLAGMYFTNTMTSISLTAERYFSELENNSLPDVAKKTAFQASMIPQINGLLAVGLVSLPGMMTGQILSGVSPLIAVRYQIMIMAMGLGTAGVGSFLFLWYMSRKHQGSKNQEE